eukprot:jgi/Tetstr1/430995/TSEL_020749.t1
MTAAGGEMRRHHTEPTLLRVGDDHLCAISLGKEDEEFADTLRLAVALTSHVALLRAIRLRTIVIYLTESEFDPSELLIHPFSQTIREAGELGGNTGRNQIRRVAIGILAQDIVDSVREDQGRASSGTRREAPCGYITSPTTGRPNRTTSSSDPSSLYRTPEADDEEELQLNHVENDSAMEVDTTQGAAAETPAANLASLAAETHQLRNPQRLSIQLERHPSQSTLASKGKAATTAKHKKKQPKGRSRSDGATRNRSRSKLRLSGAHGSDSEWETDDEAAHPSSSSHQ